MLGGVDREEMIRDSRAACASTQGKLGRSWDDPEGPGVHCEAVRTDCKRDARGVVLLRSLRDLEPTLATFMVSDAERLAELRMVSNEAVRARTRARAGEQYCMADDGRRAGTAGCICSRHLPSQLRQFHHSCHVTASPTARDASWPVPEGSSINSSVDISLYPKGGRDTSNGSIEGHKMAAITYSRI